MSQKAIRAAIWTSARKLAASLSERVATGRKSLTLAHSLSTVFRLDDHRMIRGIVHTPQSGARWRDCLPEYGPYTTVHNRFNRWSRQGVWTGIFKALTGHSGIWTGEAAIDSTSVKAHRSAAGAKEELSSRA